MQSLPMPKVAETSKAPTRYAGFWPRLAATLTDTLLVVPLTMAGLSVSLHSHAVALLVWVPLNAAGLAYEVFFHATRGQTLGKRLLGIRVIKLSGDPIGWRGALIRSSVGIALTLGSGAASLMALSRLEPTVWSSGLLDLYQQIKSTEPAWGRWLSGAAEVWGWSELLVLLFNDRRRALHDFMAGTIVVRDPR
jgi:uncharacterized RDD family membrane protein YckC